MRSGKPLLATAMTLLCAPLAGCVATAISPDAVRCSELLPNSWDKGVDSVDLPETAKLPDGHDDARPWQEGFVGQTGRLEMSNGRYQDGIGIVRRCEERNAAAVKKARRRIF